jgi:hypothetical protein
MNTCEGCKNVCCVNFKITTELVNPEALRQELTKFPFIKKTGRDVILKGRKEVLVGIYNCDRFDKTTKTCIDYSTKPRPIFCINTGVTTSPNESCILKVNQAVAV